MIPTEIDVLREKHNIQLREIPEGSIPVQRASYVTGLFGRRGSGKSAAMAYIGLQDWKRGRSIFYYPVDFGLDVPGAVAMSPEELVTMPDRLDGATVLLDEMQELMSKFRTNTISSLLMMSFLRQVRKRGASVYFTSNDPGGINRDVAEQTDYHAHCQMLTDNYCALIGYHRRGCLDTVRLRWKDTQGVHGENRYKKDGRKGFVMHMVGISDIYKHYNTNSIADPMDVMMMTKSSIAARRNVDGLGMTVREFETKLAEVWIPALVAQGITIIAPGNFIRVLKREEGIDIDSAQLGKRLGGIGLPRHRRKTGNIYKLPPPESVGDFLDGVWEPDDDL